MADAEIGVGDSAPARLKGMESPATATRNEEALLRLYVGKNSDAFVKLYRRRAEGERWGGFWTQVNWVAGLLGLPWFFYRKLYLEGAALLLVPIVIIYVFPAIEKIQLGISGVLAVVANMYYLERVLKQIKKIEARPLPEAERDELIRKSGGTSIPGAILGTVILGGTIGTAFVASTSKAKLPPCESETIRSMVRKDMTENFRAKNVPTDKVEYDNFIVLGAPDETKWSCQFTLVFEGQVAGLIRFDILWDGGSRQSVRLLYNPENR